MVEEIDQLFRALTLIAKSFACEIEHQCVGTITTCHLCKHWKSQPYPRNITMKIQLFALTVAYATYADAFAPTISSAQRTSTFLGAEVNSMWAFDAYGRRDGQLSSQEIMHVEGDPWYFNPGGGIGQSDFYPLVSENDIFSTSSGVCSMYSLPASPKSWTGTCRQPAGYYARRRCGPFSGSCFRSCRC